MLPLQSAVPAGIAGRGSALGQGQRVRFPWLAWADRDYVVVGVKQDGLGTRFAGALADERGRTVRSLHRLDLDAGVSKGLLNPLRCLLGFFLEARLVVYGVERNEFFELREDIRAIICDVVRNSSHVVQHTRRLGHARQVLFGEPVRKLVLPERLRSCPGELEF